MAKKALEQAMLEGWKAKRAERDQRRADNRARWEKRRDWAHGDNHKLAVTAEVAPLPGESRSLTRLRAIMADPDVALFRRLDAAEIILNYELAPGSAVGIEPDQIAASSYQFLNAAVEDEQTPDGLRFRALRSVAAVENARAALKNGALSDVKKRELMVHVAAAERQRELREQGFWRDRVAAGEDWAEREPVWRDGWPGHWQWPPASFAKASDG